MIFSGVLLIDKLEPFVEFTKFKMQEWFIVREYPGWQLPHMFPPTTEVQAIGMQTCEVPIWRSDASLKHDKQRVAYVGTLPSKSLVAQGPKEAEQKEAEETVNPIVQIVVSAIDWIIPSKER